jgi:hypothetical protein
VRATQQLSSGGSARRKSHSPAEDVTRLCWDVSRTLGKRSGPDIENLATQIQSDLRKFTNSNALRRIPSFAPWWARNRGISRPP